MTVRQELKEALARVVVLEQDIVACRTRIEELEQELEDCQQPAPEPEPEPEPITKPKVLAGVLSRSGAEGPDGWNPEVKIGELFPTADGVMKPSPNPIDAAIAKGKPFRLRPMWGSYAAPWMLEKFGMVELVNPQATRGGMACRWWESGFMQFVARATAQIAEKYDGHPLMRGIFVSAAMPSLYAEPCIKGLSEDVNRANLKAAGYDGDKDIVAQQRFLDAHAIFSETWVGYAFNPYQFMRADGSWFISMPHTLGLMDYLIEAVPFPFLNNNSLRQTYLANAGNMTTLYQAMRQRRQEGTNIGFQTATGERIHPKGDGATEAEQSAALKLVMATAITWGASVIERPSGVAISPADMTTAQTGLKGNVA